MAAKTAKPSVAPPSNKDLSCLRCRKKKAKCSKTRPQCTRCARSFQPCEYPDAPPNLTDLSQKVLTLYDTLRELEGEFLVKYMHSISNGLDQETDDGFDATPPFQFTPSRVEEDDRHLNKKPKTMKIESPEEDNSIQEPGGWSVTLTPYGLTIHAMTRNLFEFNELAKNISNQIVRDFGTNYLPKHWDPDAEGYFENSDVEDDLDEDEYLVTVPVISTASLLLNTDPKLKVENRGGVSMVEEEDIRNYYGQMVNHLQLRYQWLEHEQQHYALHPIVVLMQQIKPYLPQRPIDPLSEICLLTAYVVSLKLLPPLPNTLDSLWKASFDLASHLWIDLVLSSEIEPVYLNVLCAVLLGWVETEIGIGRKTDIILHLAFRLLSRSEWEKNPTGWEGVIGSLLYLDVYSSTFQFKKAQLKGEESLKILKKLNDTSGNFQLSGILLEAKLMSLLNKVVSLFYEIERNQPQVRKIDVDEVLTLVRDIEIWEHELPDWAKWNHQLTTEELPRLGLKMHMHMIHNMVKILLFRPFSSNIYTNQQEIEQTYTKTIFLDMSTNSADRLTRCLCHMDKYFTGFWTNTAGHLVRDVSTRVLNMFHSDEDIVDQLDIILKRLEKAESIKLSIA